MTPRVTLAIAATAAFGGIALYASPAPAMSRAPSSVTIQAEGIDLSGMVKSQRTACTTERKVIVFKQRGERGGGDDIRVASDLTEHDGGEWSTGNTGREGRFYARIRKTDRCQGDTSPTIRVSR